MQFRELKITDFGKFHRKNISLKEGVNLIYGENEAGKSTIHAFLRGMLFGIDKPRGRVSREDIYTRYQPWDGPSVYRGSLDFTAGEKNFRLIRNFDKNNKSTTLLDLDTGRELDGEKERIREILGGLTESGYLNTVSMEQQRIKTGPELAGEIRNYIANLSLSGTNEVDVNKALAFLQEKKKELEGKRPLQELKETRESIEKSLALEQRGDSLVGQISSAAGALSLAEEKCRNLEEGPGEGSMDYDYLLFRHPIMEEKLSEYEKIREQRSELQRQRDGINRELLQASGNSSLLLKESLDTARSREREREELAREKNSLMAEALKGSGSGKAREAVIPALVLLTGIILFLFGIWNSHILMPFGILLVLAAGGMVVLNRQKLKGANEALEAGMAQADAAARKKKDEENRIFEKYCVKDIKELSDLYENTLRIEIERNYKEAKRKDCIRQLEQFEKREEEIGGELQGYLELFSGYGNERGEQLQLNGEAFAGMKEYLTQKQAEAKERKAEFFQERDRLKLILEQLKWELNALSGNEEELLLCQEREKKLREMDEGLKIELEAVITAMDTIKKLSLQIHDSFGSTLNRQVSRIAAELTQKKYQKIIINENLDMKAEDGEEFRALDRLSTGTMEQFFFALRLSASDLLYEKGLPVLLDDCFAYYDDRRTAAALSYLAESGRQVLVFTCHHREKEILEEKGIPYNYVNLMEY